MIEVDEPKPAALPDAHVEVDESKPKPSGQTDLRNRDKELMAKCEMERVFPSLKREQPPQAQLPPVPQPADPQLDPFASIQDGTSKGQPPWAASKGGPRYGDVSTPWTAEERWAWHSWQGWEDRRSTSKGKSKGWSSHSWEISTSSPALQHQEWTRLLRQWNIDNQAKDLFWNLALTPGCEREAAGIIDEFLRQIRDIENRSSWLQRAVNNAVHEFRHPGSTKGGKGYSSKSWSKW